MDWLKCNICFNTYNESSLRPRSLSCGHTFCERCLNNTIQNKTLTCPQCRKIHELKSAIDLPINFTLEGLLKSLNPCSQDINEGAISKPIEGESETDDKSDTHGSLKSVLEQHERSLSAQKELLKKSAGMCMEHPSKECLFRCSLHMSWVCELCIDEQGDHSNLKCKITSFKEEIENRKQGHKRSLDDEGISCDETLSVMESHIFHLRDERESHISLISILQDLINMHKDEEEHLQKEINYFLEIVEKGKNIKQRLLGVEATVLKVETLDDSNSARDIVKNKKAEARNWVNTSQREVNEGKLKIEKSTHKAMATKMSLEYRTKCELLQQESKKNVNKSGPIVKSANKIKSRDIEFTRKNLNKIAHLYENELNDVAKSRKEPWNFWDIVIKVQLVLLGLLSKISDNDKDDEITTWAVKASPKDCSVLAGQLVSSNGRLLLQSMQTYDSLPLKAITLPFDDIMALLPSPPVAFLTLTHNDGTTLGNLHIRLDGQSYPRSIRLFVELATGSTDKGGYGNTWFDWVVLKDKPGEWITCNGYCNTAGDKERDALYHLEEATTRNLLTEGTDKGGYRNAWFEWVVLKDQPGEWINCNGYCNTAGDKERDALYHLEEDTTRNLLTEGTIYGCYTQSARFLICTRSHHTATWQGPALGHITSGLTVLKDAIKKYSGEAKVSFKDKLPSNYININVYECGVIIDSTE